VAKDKADKLAARAMNTGSFALAASILLALLDGYIRGYLKNVIDATHVPPATLIMFGEWAYSLRNVSDTVLEAAAIVFVGAKFLESRTLLSVGFDKADAQKVAVKGPDEDDVVWVGHRYSSRLEAETVVDAVQKRLKDAEES
jgi:hypothetical protein